MRDPSLYHVGMTVSDLERSVRFYTAGLGFEEHARQTSAASYLSLTGYPGVEIAAAFVRSPGGRLELELQEYHGIEQGALRPAGTAPVGSVHMCLVVGNLVDALAQAERHGGRRVTDPVEIDSGMNAGALGVYLRDPDGVTIELFQPARPEKAPG